MQACGKSQRKLLHAVTSEKKIPFPTYTQPALYKELAVIWSTARKRCIEHMRSFKAVTSAEQAVQEKET